LDAKGIPFAVWHKMGCGILEKNKDNKLLSDMVVTYSVYSLFYFLYCIFLPKWRINFFINDSLLVVLHCLTSTILSPACVYNTAGKI